MAATTISPSEVAVGSHVCWVVDEPGAYVAQAGAILAEGGRRNEKPFVFGPRDSADLATLRGSASRAGDPAVDVLGGGPLAPETMFAMFHEQTAAARDEGYRGLRLVADMDWLLPGQPTTAAIVGFELLLDRVVAERGATVVCAYRTGSFPADAVVSAQAVHPHDLGVAEPPPFRLVAGPDGTWQLTGEVDAASAASFRAALTAAGADGVCVVDVSGLDFIDVAGMRAVVGAARTSGATVRLVHARPLLARAWRAAAFDEVPVTVELHP